MLTGLDAVAAWLQWQPANAAQEIAKMRALLALLAEHPEHKEPIEEAVIDYTRTLGSNEHTAYVWYAANS